VFGKVSKYVCLIVPILQDLRLVFLFPSIAFRFPFTSGKVESDNCWGFSRGFLGVSEGLIGFFVHFVVQKTVTLFELLDLVGFLLVFRYLFALNSSWERRQVCVSPRCYLSQSRIGFLLFFP
jgi:hypothetical protein